MKKFMNGNQRKTFVHKVADDPYEGLAPPPTEILDPPLKWQNNKEGLLMGLGWGLSYPRLPFDSIVYISGKFWPNNKWTSYCLYNLA